MKVIQKIKQLVLTLFIVVFSTMTIFILLLTISFKQYSNKIVEDIGHSYQLEISFPAGPYYSYVMNGLECTVYDYMKVSTGVASKDQEARYKTEYELLSSWSKLNFPKIDITAQKIQSIIQMNGMTQKSYIELSRVFDSLSYKSSKDVRWFFYLVLENSNLTVLYGLLFIFSLSLIVSIALKLLPDDFYYDYEDENYEDEILEEKGIEENQKKQVFVEDRVIIHKDHPMDSQGNTRII